MNQLFLINGLLLSGLSGFLFWQRRGQLTLFFLISNIALAVWNLCIYLTETVLFPGWIDAIARAQLIAAMCFVNGYYYLCTSYPRADFRFNWAALVNLICFLVLGGFVVFTDLITSAHLIDGRVVYQDSVLGYGLYTFYLMFFCGSSLAALVMSYRQHREYRAQIKYLFLGIALFVGTAIICNLILPVLGEYRFLPVGRLSAIFPLLFFSYVIIKHSFLEIDVIINKRSSWAAVFLLITGGVAALHAFIPEWVPLREVMLTIAAVGLGMAASPMQRFLLTTAKRKFVRGWYSTEAVIGELASKLTLEKDRRAIFRTVAATLDEVFEVESTLLIVAERDENGELEHYKVIDDPSVHIDSSAALILAFSEQSHCRRVRELDAGTLTMLEQLGLSAECITDGVVLPCHSPEFLEGLIILGQRSNEQQYNENDLRFFDNLLAFLSPIFYRLTPMETLEALYFENKQRLHEAEIQLLRAQKIDAIVHATRQCHHEIRTPLSIISLGISRIKNLEELESFKQVAQEEIKHALEIVEETLAISDINKSAEKAHTRVNINDVIRRCLRLIDTLKYKVHLELEEDLPPVIGYFSDLQVVLTNLIHNAMEAMPNGGAFTFTSRASHDTVIVTVEDTGSGIPEELKSRVWEPYFSGRATRAGNSTAGRGWGLTIVNRIITEHRGTIRFVSEAGSGTRFIITLPLARNEEQDEEGHAEPEALPRVQQG